MPPKKDCFSLMKDVIFYKERKKSRGPWYSFAKSRIRYMLNKDNLSTLSFIVSSVLKPAKIKVIIVF